VAVKYSDEIVREKTGNVKKKVASIMPIGDMDK